MILTLPDTTTSQIATTLAEAREKASVANGRVLTLLVAANGNDNVDVILETVRNATRKNPARVLVCLLGNPKAETSIDALLLIGADAGASEIIVMELNGELTEHLDAVVTPLLLPDTPIVAWWPTFSPTCPAKDQIGTLAQRRITTYSSAAAAAEGYTPGDSDMMWSRITAWRAVVASALDRCLESKVAAVEISGLADDPSVDIAAGWLASALNVPVSRSSASTNADAVPIAKLTLHASDGDITVETIDGNTVAVSVPNHPTMFAALSARTDAECLAEELRHLGPDATYGRALQGVKIHADS